MLMALDDFKIVLSKLNANYDSEVSCPRKQNQVCLQNYNTCLKGRENDCNQRLKFSINKRLFDIEVIFWGKDRKGEINTSSLSVKNFVEKTKVDLSKLEY